MSENTGIFQFETVGDILIVVPVRDFMTVRDTDLRDAYNETYRLLSGDTVRHLIFDFAHLDYFGSSFVGILIRLARKSRGDGGGTVLVHMNDEIQRILKQLMLLENPNTDFFWKLAETRAAAIEWLNTEFQTSEQ